MKKTGIIIFITLIASIILAAGCQSQISPTDSGGIKTDCQKEESYTAQVPYNETEFYYVKEGVGRPTCNEEQYTDFTLKVTSLGKVCQITVANTGNITGDWTLRAKFITTEAGGGPVSDPLTKEIKPGETVKFEYTYTQSDVPRSCTNVNDETPSVEVCKYTFNQDVRKSRIITKFREETKTRMVPCD